MHPIFRFFWLCAILSVNMAVDENNETTTSPSSTESSETTLNNDAFSNLIRHTETHEVVAGSNVLLSCPFETLGGLLNVDWYKINKRWDWHRENETLTHNFEVISDDLRYNVFLEYNLEISGFQKSDYPDYKCVLESGEHFFYYIYVFNNTKDLIDDSAFFRRHSIKKFKTEGATADSAHRSQYTYVNEIINHTIILPCEGIHMISGKDYLKWQNIITRENEDVEKAIFSQRSEYEAPENGSKMKILSGYSLEIQNVQYSDGESEYVCKIQNPKNANETIIVHKIVVLDPSLSKTKSMCTPSPCGLNADCRPNAGYPDCVCRHNFKGTPPNCKPDCLKNCKASLACLNDNCKRLKEKSCGENASVIIQNYKYACSCPDDFLGDPTLICESVLAERYSTKIDVNVATGKTYNETENNSVTLSCEFSQNEYEVSRYNNNSGSEFNETLPLIQWKKKQANKNFWHDINLPAQRMKTYTVWNLWIRKLTNSDAGFYICRINDSRFYDIIYNLEILGDIYEVSKPNIRKSITTIQAKKDGAVILPCEGVNHLDFGSITWIYKDEITSPIETPIKSNSRTKFLKGKNLEIQNLQTEDAGNYSCFVKYFKFGYMANILKASHELKILDSALFGDRQSDPCFGYYCGENSECYTKKGAPVCSCRPNYSGTPPDCKEDCPDKNCIDLACLSDRCEKLCKGSCELQKNASCRIQSYRWSCKCDDGFSGNSNEECLPENFVNFVEGYEVQEQETCGVKCLLLSINVPVVLLLLITTAIFLIIKKWKKRRTDSLVEEFASQPLDRHAAYLSEYYDKKWEFSRDRLIIKDFIGEGHFAKVFKADAIGISGSDGSTVVAVKTLKKNTTDFQLDDFISEYQSLKEFNHQNIIRLLGVCIKDSPLYIIMEYAENGSLRSYLQKIKKNMISAPGDREKIYTPVYSSLQPKTIITFAWHIAKGMSYLAAMRYVHRDLAARNILLTKDLICKISDFGLTRDVYRDGEYFRTSRGELPIKWIAFESLCTDSYSTKSDVWSFGVVLWELITFGSNPYPGLQLREIYNFLKEGNRMEKPEGCSDDFYGIMLSCWKEDPADRPHFQNLVDIFEGMLSKGTDYLQFNDEDQDGYAIPRLHQISNEKKNLEPEN